MSFRWTGVTRARFQEVTFLGVLVMTMTKNKEDYSATSARAVTWSSLIQKGRLQQSREDAMSAPRHGRMVSMHNSGFLSDSCSVKKGSQVSQSSKAPQFKVQSCLPWPRQKLIIMGTNP